MEFPARVREILRIAADKVLAGREVDFPIVTECDRTAVMALAGVGGVLRVLIEDKLTSRDGAAQRGIGREARQTITLRRSERVEDVVVMVDAEIRIKG